MLPLLPALLLCLAGCCCCCSALRQPPRRLDSCPSDFEALVEPLPASVGEPVLLAGPGVRFRSVRFLRDPVLKVEANRLLMSQSIDASQDLPFSGPYVILCSEPSQPLVTFLLFFQLPDADTQQEPAPALAAAAVTASDPLSADGGCKLSVSDPRLLVLIIAACLATCLAVALSYALAAALMRLRHRRSRVDGGGLQASCVYRDFRHLAANCRPPKLEA